MFKSLFIILCYNAQKFNLLAMLIIMLTFFIVLIFLFFAVANHRAAFECDKGIVNSYRN